MTLLMDDFFLPGSKGSFLLFDGNFNLVQKYADFGLVEIFRKDDCCTIRYEKLEKNLTWWRPAARLDSRPLRTESELLLTAEQWQQLTDEIINIMPCSGGNVNLRNIVMTLLGGKILPFNLDAVRAQRLLKPDHE